MAEHNELGNLGEERAQAYLREKGYTIRHTNWHNSTPSGAAGKLELDIVAEKEGMLIVVEVKTRSTETFEHPAEAITKRKIRNIIKYSNRRI